ncbi:MAG: sensor histidine kinase [Chloroflexi bacterium]|jgi:signal transduction histidine kinase|nr:sensor histidine kinase [Anaerolineaceae bacterium]NMB88693.1 sensor histidine kinase [Chloroflexota bacterium]
MDASKRPSVIKTGAGADLAFAVMLMASYFAIFSALPQASTFEIIGLIFAGITYVSIGIYGYAYCAHASLTWLNGLYFLVQMPLGGWIVYMSKGTGLNALILLPLAGQAVMLLSSRGMLLANVSLMVTYVYALSAYTNDWDFVVSALPTFLAAQVFVTLFTQMALNEERARREVERLAQELAAANQQLREYAVQAEELATTRERNRLAREIHDGLGHYLTTVHMQIQAARAVLPKDLKRGMDALEKAQNLTQDALVDVRASVAALRTAPEDSLPLPERVSGVVESVRQNGLQSNLTISGEPRLLSPQADLTLYRAAQEGLNNVCKHAHASSVEVTLDYQQAGWVTLTVQDNGLGSSQPGDGFGLVGLRERVHLLNGSFQVDTAQGEGFTMLVGVPG